MNSRVDGDDQSRLIYASVKIVLLLLTACSVHRSLSPPNPSVKSEECCSGTEGTDTLFEKFVQSITYCSKCMVWMCVWSDIVFILVRLVLFSTLPDDLKFGWEEYVTPDAAVDVGRERIPAVMVLGVLSATIAAGLRMWCFNSLGPFFTFEITIQPKHRLITHGPYAWVRHPSYTGVYLTLVGATLVLSSPGSWMVEYGVRTPLGFLASAFWVVKCVFAFRGMSVRLKAEDDILRDTFGAQWEEYAARVPSKFLPGVV
ncbi:ICMT-domain-containing protein [Pholiota conissans]|uniref:Protein-S-isoprenylcysteine O-methyltransferase n=1 Tax=Pholiota conissans TaxID=109636 RepID=A0A9P6CQT9_9AGAR|nr:ICMT-domain-containing protein [Pholiota conissans]